MPTKPYYVNGKRVPSVTTILSKFKDPGALMHWSWNTAYQVLEESVHHLQRLIQGAYRDKEEIQNQARKFLASKPLSQGHYREKSEDACEAGTICHAVIEECLNLKPTLRTGFLRRLTLRDILIRYKQNKDISRNALNGIRAFEQWMDSHKFEFLRTETPLESTVYHFGGTIDSIGKIDGRRALFDWKTSNRVYADYLCQLAAYAILWDEAHPRDPVREFRLLRFDKTTGAFAEFAYRDLAQARRLFLIYREAYDLLKSLEKMV